MAFPVIAAQATLLSYPSYNCSIGHSSYAYDYYNGSMSDYLQMRNSVRHQADLTVFALHCIDYCFTTCIDPVLLIAITRTAAASTAPASV